jgi:RNA recognition motif-containing protein
MDPQSGESKGFGCVGIPNDDEANAVIKRLHGQKFDGNKIRVKVENKDK